MHFRVVLPNSTATYPQTGNTVESAPLYKCYQYYGEIYDDYHEIRIAPSNVHVIRFIRVHSKRSSLHMNSLRMDGNIRNEKEKNHRESLRRHFHWKWMIILFYSIQWAAVSVLLVAWLWVYAQRVELTRKEYSERFWCADFEVRFHDSSNEVFPHWNRTIVVQSVAYICDENEFDNNFNILAIKIERGKTVKSMIQLVLTGSEHYREAINRWLCKFERT